MTERLHEVRLIGYPLALYAKGQEHHNELMREFSLIAISGKMQSMPSVPSRLVELIERLTAEYGTLSQDVERERDEAYEAGLKSIDLAYHAPPIVAEAVKELGRMLDEADDYCRAGDALLTLATPPDVKLFRDWFFSEFTGQLSGADPTPWPEYAGRAAEART
ncbi:MAG: hypothetical protein WCB04_11155 [Mycobacteriales bacterium]